MRTSKPKTYGIYHIENVLWIDLRSNKSKLKWEDFSNKYVRKILLESVLSFIYSNL